MIKVYLVKNWLDRVTKCNDNSLIASTFISSLFNDIHIKKDNRGKPYLLNDNRFINWSHNDEYLAIAFCEKSDIGIDIENINIPYDESFYSWILHEEEKLNLENGTLFSEIWTRKESILKYTGEGLIDNLSEINCYNNNSFYIESFIIDTICVSICSKFKGYVEIISL